MVIIEDNWLLIESVLLENNDWVDTGTIKRRTGIYSSTIIELLNTAVKRGEAEKQFKHFKTTPHSKIGMSKRYKYFWRLVK